MRINADFHIHSYLSRATSKDSNLEYIYKWCQLKGIQVVGTGDFTHPHWLEQIKEKLEPAEDGLFKLKDKYAQAIQTEVFPAAQGPVRFIISGEISSIYKKDNRLRKIHNLIILPDLKTAYHIQNILGRLGNIRSDGRPILGLDARDLLEIVLESHPQSCLIPAHIWTPWFSLFGSKSGFNSIEECFDDLSPYIFSLETGLSSDPAMNWQLSQLDRFTLISNSDAHSPQKIAREATIFETELSYPAMLEAMKTRNSGKFLGTIEFFPEEGKYHYDGHRLCQTRLSPVETRSNRGLCPICGKPVTVGVMSRVQSLADRTVNYQPPDAPPYYSLIPLEEVLAEINGVGVNSKQVQQVYQTLLSSLGSELDILMNVPLDEIARVGTDIVAEATRRMRNRDIHPLAGYDGQFGKINVFQPGEKEQFSSQLSLLECPIERAVAPTRLSKLAGMSAPSECLSTITESSSPPQPSQPFDLNQEQLEAVFHQYGPLLIVAGPGTGKTQTMTCRIAHLINQRLASPEEVLAVTFTNKAAEEMKARLMQMLGEEITLQMTIKTFHSLGLAILRQEAEYLHLPTSFIVLGEPEKLNILKDVIKGKAVAMAELTENISRCKSSLIYPQDLTTYSLDFVTGSFMRAYSHYQEILRQNSLVDYDDLIGLVVKLFQANQQLAARYRDRFRWISVDEYQDINLAQYTLLRLLTTEESNLCVIGDADQAIYGFRGASAQFFKSFQQDYPRARIVTLTQNYRSTETILNASNQVIIHHPDRQLSKLRSGLVSDRRINIHQSPTDLSEAEFIIWQIEQLMGGTSHLSLDSGRINKGEEQVCHSFSDIAVLYRVRGQSRVLIEAFERSGIPYQTVGEIPFMHRLEINSAITYLRLLQYPDSNLSGQSLKSLPKLYPSKKAVWELIREIIREYNLDMFYPEIQQSGKKLIEMARPFGHNLLEFLEFTVLAREADFYSSQVERVMLMTLHASKGLEFPVVFISGCEDSLIPYTLNPSNLEEERRLLYVGMTRAQHVLYLTYAQTRFLYGQRYNNPPSRFLADIEEAIKATTRSFQKRKKPELSAQLKLSFD